MSPALVLFFSSETTAADRDRLVALLADYGLVAIQEDDVASPTQWIAHFVDTASRDSAGQAIHRIREFHDLRLERTEIDDEDWARRTQADLPAIRIGRIVVAPPWDVQPEAPGTMVVIIEPSRGFGTGHHQSTRLALTLLQDRDLAGTTTIDVGTGSGILAIAAARLGAASSVAIDVDPDAIDNARENVERNGVSGVVDVQAGDLAHTDLGPADVVTANLTGSLLTRYAWELSRLVKPGGVLIAAGFTVEEFERVKDGFAPTLAIVASAEEEGWAGFALTSNSQRPTPNSRRTRLAG